MLRPCAIVTRAAQAARFRYRDAQGLLVALGAGEKCRDILGRLSAFRSRRRSASTRIAFLALAWPWLSGAVAIPYDATSQFYPQLAFLARSLATGQSPFWTPNVFAGWPQIADPQSLIFSPLHFVVALLDPNPSPWLADALVFALLYAGGARRDPVLPRPRLACRRRAGRGAGVFVRRLGRLAHPARRPDRKPGVPAAGAVDAGARARALVVARRRGRRACSPRSSCSAAIRWRCIAIYVLAGFVLWHWLGGAGSAGADRRERQAARGRRGRRRADRDRAGDADGAAGRRIPTARRSAMPSPAGGSLHPANLLMLVFADLFGASDFNREFWGPPGFPWHDAFGQTDLVRRAEHRPDLCRRAGRRRGARLRRGARPAVGARDPLLHRRDGADAALRARQVHAGVSSDVRRCCRACRSSAGRPMRPSCSARCWRSSPAISCTAG